ncbi:RagB/SusD family nutrient uptake outer membrane protein [Chitinophaga agrisoli]|uniref:RagB/SusD family nutrient uptake outer membrane protein n=1 Tax=Chitinophaga agrisoli TaxID=2607653 RepID=A0A5B2W032_9BACT|nr:RagB/SusD family nutrient uptake outer membrane protein [Chitinophaga agrisoli]KAA2243757.1 RagB/SusD family nutrient uptake outer membrane protein [Chitinophaga agrisoli]
MKHNITKYIKLASLLLVLGACQKGDIPNLNTPDASLITVNPTKGELDNLVTGLESGMRFNLGTYLEVVGVVGREIYRFAGSEPRYTIELLGGGASTLDNNTFYITNPWASRYRTVRQGYLLIEGAQNATTITEPVRKGYLGIAHTIMAYQLLLNLNMTDENGIRVDVADYKNLGPFVEKTPALEAIAQMLDQGQADLTGAEIAFPLASGFDLAREAPDNALTAAGLIRFNRALAARVAVYRQQWAAALTALNASFFDLNGSTSAGFYNSFSTNSNDQLNPLFVPQNQSGEIRLAHPSYATDIAPGDDRIAKATLRNASATQNGLTSNRDAWVYTSNSAPIPIIRNEELVLIYAEAKIQTNAFPDAIVALNRIRIAHNLPAYTGALTQAALLTEMLQQRRYSLFFEGHRWVDMRRYGRLGELPKDRPGDDVWEEFPIPQTENN